MNANAKNNNSRRARESYLASVHVSFRRFHAKTPSRPGTQRVFIDATINFEPLPQLPVTPTMFISSVKIMFVGLSARQAIHRIISLFVGGTIKIALEIWRYYARQIATNGSGKASD
jgi:hypothetical protein